MKYIAIILLFVCNIGYSCIVDVQALSWLMFKRDHFTVNNQHFTKLGDMFIVNATTIARQQQNILYDCSGSQAARLQGDMIYNQNGTLLYRYVGNNVYNSSGKLLYMFNGSTIIDNIGKTYN